MSCIVRSGNCSNLSIISYLSKSLSLFFIGKSKSFFNFRFPIIVFVLLITSKTDLYLPLPFVFENIFNWVWASFNKQDSHHYYRQLDVLNFLM